MKKRKNTICHITVDTEHALDLPLFGRETPKFRKYMALIPGKPANGEVTSVEIVDPELTDTRFTIARLPTGGAYFSMWRKSDPAGLLIAGAIAVTPSDDIGAWTEMRAMGVVRDADLHNAYPYLSVKICPGFETVPMMQALCFAGFELVIASVVLAKYRQESESGC